MQQALNILDGMINRMSLEQPLQASLQCRCGKVKIGLLDGRLRTRLECLCTDCRERIIICTDGNKYNHPGVQDLIDYKKGSDLWYFGNALIISDETKKLIDFFKLIREDGARCINMKTKCCNNYMCCIHPAYKGNVIATSPDGPSITFTQNIDYKIPPQIFRCWKTDFPESKYQLLPNDKPDIDFKDTKDMEKYKDLFNSIKSAFDKSPPKTENTMQFEQLLNDQWRNEWENIQKNFFSNIFSDNPSIELCFKALMTEKYGLHKPWINRKKEDYCNVGQLIDAYDLSLKIWAVAQTIDKKDNEIKVHWYGWDEKYDEWININDNTKIAPLQTHTFPMIPLLTSSTSFEPICKPLLYNSSILLPRINNKYEITRNEWSQMSDNDEYCSLHGPYYMFAIDDRNGKLFCILLNEHGTVCSSDINDNINDSLCRFEQHNDSFHCDLSLSKNRFLDNNEKTIYCQIIGHELHIIDSDPFRHYVYNINTKEWIFNAVPSILYQPNFQMEFSQFVYIKSMNIFIGFINSGNGDFISYQCKGNESEWIENAALSSLHVDFKYDNGHIDDVINIFDHLLLINKFSSKHKGTQIIMFDLLTSKWFVCDKMVPVDKEQHIINTMDNYLHFMQQKSHFKIHLMDIIPFELDKVYRDNKYNKLIFGFVKQIEQNNKLWYNLPFYLKSLILKYFPCFLY